MAKPDLTIFIPTRGRPDSAQAVLESFKETCTANTQVVFVLDADDPEKKRYFEVEDAVTLTLPNTRRGMTSSLRKAYDWYASCNELGFAVGFMGDDHRPRTVGWDADYIATLHQLGTGFVYGDDLLQHERIPTQVAMTSDIPKKLGNMVPDDLHHLYVDDYWKALGQGVDRIQYLPDVVVEHLHYLNGKAEEDEGYKVVNSSEMAQHDARAWKLYRKTGKLQKDIDLLKELL